MTLWLHHCRISIRAALLDHWYAISYIHVILIGGQTDGIVFLPTGHMPYIDGDAYIHFINWLLPLYTQIKSVSCRELLARLVLKTLVRQQYVLCLNLQPTLNTFALGFSSYIFRYTIFQLFSYAFTCNSVASKPAKIQQQVRLIK